MARLIVLALLGVNFMHGNPGLVKAHKLNQLSTGDGEVQRSSTPAGDGEAAADDTNLSVSDMQKALMSDEKTEEKSEVKLQVKTDEDPKPKAEEAEQPKPAEKSEAKEQKPELAEAKNSEQETPTE